MARKESPSTTGTVGVGGWSNKGQATVVMGEGGGRRLGDISLKWYLDGLKAKSKSRLQNGPKAAFPWKPLS